MFPTSVVITTASNCCKLHWCILTPKRATCQFCVTETAGFVPQLRSLLPMHLIAHGETKIVFRQVDVNAFCPPYFIQAAQRKLNAKDAQCFSWKWHSQQFTLFQSIHTHTKGSLICMPVCLNTNPAFLQAFWGMPIPIRSPVLQSA